MTQQQETGTRRQNTEQKRGQQAWKNIKAIKGMGKTARDYRPLARGLNSMIQINGLGQTLGFLYAKSKDDKGRPDTQKAHYQLLAHLSSWMREHFSAPNADKIDDEYYGLLSWVLDKDTTSSDYRRATTECLAFGNWLGRFAEAELAEDTSKGVSNG
jgi:CRISPR-associated protein Cmr5